MSTGKFFEAMGDISLTHVERALAYRPGRRQHLTRWAAMAACIILIAAAGLTFAQRSIAPGPASPEDNGSITPPPGDSDGEGGIAPGPEDSEGDGGTTPEPGDSEGEGVLEITELDIYYVTEDNEIKSRRMETACAPNDIFGKWADLNNIPDVCLVDSVYDSIDAQEEPPQKNGIAQETPEYENGAAPETPGHQHSESEEPTAEYTYHIGTHFTFTLTLSSEFSKYTESSRGALLVESLEKTFAGYLDFDEFILVVED